MPLDPGQVGGLGRPAGRPESSGLPSVGGDQDRRVDIHDVTLPRRLATDHASVQFGLLSPLVLKTRGARKPTGIRADARVSATAAASQAMLSDRQDFADRFGLCKII